MTTMYRRAHKSHQSSFDIARLLAEALVVALALLVGGVLGFVIWWGFQ